MRAPAPATPGIGGGEETANEREALRERWNARTAASIFGPKPICAVAPQPRRQSSTVCTPYDRARARGKTA
jgi:hypothetical protein